ncbi:MAG: hypothetical protein HY646_19370 [Acidobacteria bacterium]|nr:hypothetical protein [Acidobacteriota bacterium]
MMWRRLLILDLVFVVIFVAGAFRVRRNWTDFESNHRVESVQAEREIARTAPAANVPALAAEDWTEISVKNPFSFDRNDVSIVAPKEAPLAQPKPILFGTMSIGNEWIAMLAPGQPGNRASRAMKVGELLGNWQVVEIREKSAVVAANGIRETIIMNDPAAQVPRDYTRTLVGAAPAPLVNSVPPPPVLPPVTTNAPAAPTPSGAQPPPAASPSKPMLNTPFGPVPMTEKP